MLLTMYYLTIQISNFQSMLSLWVVSVLIYYVVIPHLQNTLQFVFSYSECSMLVFTTYIHWLLLI